MNIRGLLSDVFDAGVEYAVGTEDFEYQDKFFEDFLATQDLPTFCFTLPELLEFLKTIGCDKIFINKDIWQEKFNEWKIKQ